MIPPKKSIKRSREPEYHIPFDIFKEIPKWRPAFTNPHPPLEYEPSAQPTECIERKKHVKNYMDGITIVNMIAELAERYDHHPKIIINYKSITIQYFTHTTGNITELDLYMAKKIDKLIDCPCNIKKYNKPSCGQLL